MKKIIVADIVGKMIDRDRSILDRSDFRVLRASSNDEIFEIHSKEKADLIITMLTTPGMDGEELCSRVRRDREMRDVAVILCSSVKSSEVEKCERAKASATMTLPLDLEELSRKIDMLLNVPRRESCRVLLSVKVEGKMFDESFMCTSVNISATGILIETDRNLTQNDRLECSFFLPGAKRLILRGEIVRVLKKPGAPYQYGVRFLEISGEAMTAIDAFVRKKMERR